MRHVISILSGWRQATFYLVQFNEVAFRCTKVFERRYFAKSRGLSRTESRISRTKANFHLTTLQFEMFSCDTRGKGLFLRAQLSEVGTQGTTKGTHHIYRDIPWWCFRFWGSSHVQTSEFVESFSRSNKESHLFGRFRENCSQNTGKVCSLFRGGCGAHW